MIWKTEIVKEYAPALVEAARNFADPTTRNSATIGGNIANASPAGDMAPPLLALNAVLFVASGEKGERKILIEDFFTGVNKTLSEYLIPTAADTPEKLLFAINEK